MILSAIAAGGWQAASATPSLLGTRWDFTDGSLADWRHKDNARASVVDEGGNKALRLESSFRPFEFTWVARWFAPASLEGVAHLRFRVRGDASGHRLEVHLGARPPEDDRWLYYVNAQQAVTLDFTGWRTVTFAVEHFRTPPNGLRRRDSGRIQFVEFTVHASRADVPVDVRLDDVELVGRSAEEVAEIARRQHERKRLAGRMTTALGPVERSLAALQGELDRAARGGKHVAEARVYWAALDWCARDVQRALACDELDVVRRAEPLLAELGAWVRQPGRVLGHVRDQAPAEDDPLGVDRNPFFQAVVKAMRSEASLQRSWPKGRAGYEAIADAWSFRRLGSDAAAMVWAIGRPGSPLRHEPRLAANALGLLDAIAHQHTDGDFNVDRTAANGHDPNINRFCLAPALDAWYELGLAYPDLLPGSKRKELEAGLRRLVERQVSEHGLARLARLAGRNEARWPAYPNMDVHYVLIMELAHRLWQEPRFLKERDAFLGILEGAVYPMGAFTYVHTQNECYVYHQLDVVYLARLWKLTGEPRVLALLKKTIPYYPYNVEPAGMPEYYTDACWKHYWGRGEAAGAAVIASLFGDALNQRVAETCGSIWGYERGHVAAIAADVYRPVASKPLPDGYVMFDENICGPRGRYGAWSFAANGRDYGEGFQGKDTFVGCMLTDAARRPLPLDAALQVVTAEVRLNHTGNHWEGGRCHSARERLTTAMGPDFGTLAVRYAVSRPHWRLDKDDLLPWEGTQQWFLSAGRLVGLVTLESTADERRAGVHGRIRLGVKRSLEPAGDGVWKYGRLVVKIHGHNYGRIEARPSETTILEKPAAFRSTEITLVDPISAAAVQSGEVRFPKGSRYWFLVEVLRQEPGLVPAEQVERIEGQGAIGFRFAERDRWIAVVHNPSEQAIEVDRPLGPDRASAVVVYRGGQGKGVLTETAPGRLRLEAHGHVVLVGQRAAGGTP